MAIIADILSVCFFVLAPAAVLILRRKIKWLGKIDTVLILYVLGFLFGNIFHIPGLAGIQDILSSAMVPLAIPLMLFGCTFSRNGTRSQVMALLTGMFAVVIAVIIGYLIFGRNIPEGRIVGGMLTGVYTGGTINMAALKTMLGVSEETFILLNSYDMVISFLYLTFLLTVGIKLFRKLLPNGQRLNDDGSIREALENAEANPYEGLFTRAGLRDVAFLLGVDALIIAVSAGLGLLAGDGWFMTVLVLMLTTLGIAASFWKPVRRCKYGYETGMYSIYIFSLVVASMADISKIEMGNSLYLLGYLTFVIFGSLLIHFILSHMFKVDADTMVISSVTYICSPPFVPMMAAAMKNRAVLAVGLAIGIVGYAAGNYLGFLIAELLELFP